MADFLNTGIEFLKGIGPQRAALLNQELQIFTFKDLLQHYPFRHEDRTKVHRIADLSEEMPSAQLVGKIVHKQLVGEGSKQRLTAYFTDGTGEMELLWFQGIKWADSTIKPQTPYLVYGKPQFFNGRFSIVHPETEVFKAEEGLPGMWLPVYPLTEKLKKKGVQSKTIARWQQTLLEQALPHIGESLPEYLRAQKGFLSQRDTLQQIHFPQNEALLQQAKYRLKFEELFLIQLQLLRLKLIQKTRYRGQVFKNSDLLKTFYEHHLPFELTDAQKRVVKEIYRDMASGKQMNRLLQGDVGSGKTIVAFLTMLIALSNGSQACLMAPTEILAEQHYESLKPFADALDLRIDKLTGSTKTKDRNILHQRLLNGNLHILIGTHALIEEVVQFKNLGLCIIDEQHRFGVEQRSKLWKKNEATPPHILVMTATPIPRTLAMTLYGDLDVSIINELPKGRKPIVTAHRYESQRLRVFGFLKEELKKGRQVYIVYPLIEESEKLSYKNLTDGYESVKRAFPEYQISIVHGQMAPADKAFEMQRFIQKETQMMVATTVIEVGVNVPNASVMVIENAERFGLSQLHQLRGRVGRGAEQSYCILMTDQKISREGRTRLQTMVESTDGFHIADVDLQLRGPGSLTGTQQSGVLDLVMADLAKDAHILQEARAEAEALLEIDPDLNLPEHQGLKQQLQRNKATQWSRIS